MADRQHLEFRNHTLTHIPVLKIDPFCFAFPVTIDAGVLTIDDPEFTDRPECCSMIPGGTRPVLEICWEEFEFVLGSKGAKALLDLATRRD